MAIIGRYESINPPLKIDITTGDIITPNVIRYAFHSNFENKKIRVWAYNVETVLAEKVETILRRSVLNTRPRVFSDVYIIMKSQYHAVNKRTFKTVRDSSKKKEVALCCKGSRQNFAGNPIRPNH